MSTTVTFKLNKSPSQFQVDEYTGFGIRGGVQYYDRETKQKEWTNYECVIFAKSPAQVKFYQQALVEGTIVEISGQQQKIRQFQGNNGLVLSIEILNAQIGFVGQSAPVQQQQPQRQQPAPQQQPNGFPPNTNQPTPPPQGFDDFDDDIGF